MKLSIIIVNHNTEQLLTSALQSIQSKLHRDWEVIVVDNASTDGSVEKVRQYFPWVKRIESRKNLGFAAGNNLAIATTVGTYVMLLNSDALLTPHGDLNELLKYMDEHTDVAVVSPKVILPSGKLDLAAHRGFPTPWNAFTYFSGLEYVFGKLPWINRIVGGYHRTWAPKDVPHDIEACTGAAMVVRRSAIDQVGMLDEEYFMYGEDLDWCFRFIESGWRIVYHPGLEVLHLKHQSGRRKSGRTTESHTVRSQTNKHFFDTMRQFYTKHYAGKYPSIVSRLVFLGIDIIQTVKGVQYGSKATSRNNGEG